ncbi:hypothetical protein GSI_13883 [Ganoderma sinense ZZ0214-1]|uniref:DUF6533 domain-containing protein n=1 Tax=Ganoderma sinense ZZ0214-1 TaxID=1077348 RepID=A0A2G8RRL9_9APHY|nr:hypothetical protein GSI_13883 [Ganoderma sinense ZZ0214-1]
MDSEQPAVVTLAASIRLNNMLAIIAWSLLFYDYCLTLGTEIEHFWKRARFSAVSTLFVLNRYLTLLGQIPIIVEYFVILPPMRYHQFYAVFNQAIVGLILIFRTYALYNRNKYMMIGLVTLGLALVAATLIAGNVNTTIFTSDAQYDEPSAVGCNHSLTPEQGLRNAVGWIAMLCMDTTIFILTLVKTIRVCNHMNHGVQRVLFRDGIVYYGVLVIANAVNLFTFMGPYIDDTARGMGTTLTNTLSTTLISRICLNLRDPGLHCSGDGRRTDGLWTPADSTSTTTAGRDTDLMPNFAQCPGATTQTIGSDIVLVSISHESTPHDGPEGA